MADDTKYPFPILSATGPAGVAGMMLVQAPMPRMAATALVGSSNDWTKAGLTIGPSGLVGVTTDLVREAETRKLQAKLEAAEARAAKMEAKVAALQEQLQQEQERFSRQDFSARLASQGLWAEEP